MFEPFRLFSQARDADVSTMDTFLKSALGFPTQQMGTPMFPPQGGDAPLQPPPQQVASIPPGTATDAPPDWATHQQRIFAGESGGDYDALFNYSNRSGPFAGVKVSDMTVDQALAFADPKGPYAQYVAAHNNGTVSTPMGAYQVIGSTLREAKKALGLSGDEKLTRDMQDRIGQWIMKTQGTGAWEGYKSGVQKVAAGYLPSMGDNSDLDRQEEEIRLSPEEQKRQDRKAMFMALGKGLGQMAHGEAVDISDVMNDYKERQAEMKDRLMEIARERRRRGEYATGIGIAQMNREEDIVRREQERAEDRANQVADVQSQRDYETAVRLEARGWAKEDQQTQRDWKISDLDRAEAYDTKQALRDRGWTEEDFQKNKDWSIQKAFMDDAIDANRKRIDADYAAKIDAAKTAQITKSLEGTAFESYIPRIAGMDPDQAAQMVSTLTQQEFKFNLDQLDKDQTAEQRRGVFAALTKDQPYSKEVADLAAVDPQIAQTYMTEQQKKIQAEKDTAKEQETFDRVAEIYRAAGSQEAADLAAAGNMEAADKLFLQTSGDKATADTANFEYMKSLPPERQAEFAAMQARKAGLVDAGQAAALRVEENRLNTSGEQIANIRSQRDILQNAMQIMNDPNFVSGKGSEWTMQLRQFAQQLGFTFDENLNSQEIFNSFASQMPSFMRQAGEGQTSDADAQRFANATIQLGKTPDANRAIAYIADRTLAVKEARHFAEVAYMGEHGTSGTAKDREAYVQAQLKEQGLDGSAVKSVKSADGRISTDDIGRLIDEGLSPNQPFLVDDQIYFLNDDGTVRKAGS